MLTDAWIDGERLGGDGAFDRDATCDDKILHDFLAPGGISNGILPFTFLSLSLRLKFELGMKITDGGGSKRTKTFWLSNRFRP
jgi:hypothetical protein